MLTHSSDVKDKLYPCPICGVELASRADVRSHVARDHDQKKTIKFQDQDTSVSTAANQMQEENERDSSIHPATPGEETHACNLCDKVYVSKANLLDHMRRAHTTNPAAKEHQCETCGKTFCQV
jgi:KRAB domain-containing zinc finger protein